MPVHTHKQKVDLAKKICSGQDPNQGPEDQLTIDFCKKYYPATLKTYGLDNSRKKTHMPILPSIKEFGRRKKHRRSRSKPRRSRSKPRRSRSKLRRSRSKPRRSRSKPRRFGEVVLTQDELNKADPALLHRLWTTLDNKKERTLREQNFFNELNTYYSKHPTLFRKRTRSQRNIIAENTHGYMNEIKEILNKL
jgi:hypothetical protein